MRKLPILLTMIGLASCGFLGIGKKPCYTCTTTTTYTVTGASGVGQSPTKTTQTVCDESDVKKLTAGPVISTATVSGVTVRATATTGCTQQ